MYVCTLRCDTLTKYIIQHCVYLINRFLFAISLTESSAIYTDLGLFIEIIRLRSFTNERSDKNAELNNARKRIDHKFIE